MHKVKLVIVGCLAVILFFQCSLKKDKVSMDFDNFSEGIKFKKNGVPYGNVLVPSSLHISHTYTLSFGLNENHNDTVLFISGQCYNLNDKPGRYVLSVSINVHHFVGQGEYDISKCEVFFDYSWNYDCIHCEHDPPNSFFKAVDGYVRIDEFNWNAKKGKGTFYFRLENEGSAGYTQYITDGYFSFENLN